MNEEVNIKVTQEDEIVVTQATTINRLKSEMAELNEANQATKDELSKAAATIRELSAQLGQAKSNNNLDINAVIRNVVREEIQEIDIWSYESAIEEIARQAVDVDDIADDVARNFDIFDYSDTIEEIANQAIADTDFEVSIK